MIMIEDDLEINLGRELRPCSGCVFYDGGDSGYGEECNVQNEGFYTRVRYYGKADRISPCFDWRDSNDMRKMLELDDGIKR
jgi:hypothetical protein